MRAQTLLTFFTLPVGAAWMLALAGCKPLPPSKPASEWTPQEARGAAVFQHNCARCHYPTTRHGLNGPGLQAITKLKAMPSGAPPTDERLTAVILHGRSMMPATPLDDQRLQDLLALSAYTMTKESETEEEAKSAHGAVPAGVQLPLPGLAAIALYLLVLAGVIILGVVAGRHYPPVFLVFSALFIASSGGLLMLFRWAWSLALAAVLLLAGYNLWIFSTERQPAGLVQGLLNLVFFLYLIRTEVRERLR